MIDAKILNLSDKVSEAKKADTQPNIPSAKAIKMVLSLLDKADFSLTIDDLFKIFTKEPEMIMQAELLKRLKISKNSWNDLYKKYPGDMPTRYKYNEEADRAAYRYKKNEVYAWLESRAEIIED